ncbi:MAG: thiamine ABC transporter substrate-binding protein [Spirochaetales bacterium]|nr:thiamine ABC transporter substrate-binding protein [Spirochaetales bacterium]
MKKSALLLLLLTACLAGCDRKQKAEGSSELVIYTYDSFVSEWGPAPALIPLFREQYGITPEFISAGDTGEVVRKLIMEKDGPGADLVIGIDNSMMKDVLAKGILESCNPGNYDKIPAAFCFDKSKTLIPYDYGYFAIIYDSEKLRKVPRSLEDLADPAYRDSLILMDPRTSSPGLGFLLWTVAAYGSDFTAFWERLEPSLLTVSDGWSAGYGLFTNGEAPMVLSYTTSPAYHLEYEQSERYKTALFDEGHYIQIEGMALVKGARNRENALCFIDFMLSRKAQEIIPLTNWMYPVIADAALPDSFSAAPEAEKALELELSSEQMEELLDQWLETFSR